MFRIAVCEDSPRCAEDVMTLLCQYKSGRPGLDLAVHNFSSGDDLVGGMKAGQTFDLLLLDIMMPGLSGVEVGQELRARGDDTPLVFLTSSADHALDAFRVSAVQYILKPVKECDLFPVLDKINHALKQTEERCFVVTMPEQTVKAPRSSIVYVELAGRNLMIYLEDGSVLQSKTIRTPFLTAVSPLLEDGQFLCAHKSFVLNMAHVERLTKNSYVMKNGAKLPIPRYKYADAKASYFAWLSKQGIGLLGGQTP